MWVLYSHMYVQHVFLVGFVVIVVISLTLWILRYICGYTWKCLITLRSDSGDQGAVDIRRGRGAVAVVPGVGVRVPDGVGDVHAQRLPQRLVPDVEVVATRMRPVRFDLIFSALLDRSDNNEMHCIVCFDHPSIRNLYRISNSIPN
jgi:hypothetical protein